jgi:hypothetical protein
MSSVAVTYVPGEWVAVSVPGIWLLVDLRPEHEIVQRSWSLLSASESTETTVDELLDALVSGGIRTTPAFALVRLVDDGARAIARGDASIVVGADGNERTITAAPGTVWADEPIDGAAKSIILRSGAEPAAGVELPMTSGVTMAAGIQVWPAVATPPVVRPPTPREENLAVPEAGHATEQPAGREAHPSDGRADDGSPGTADEEQPSYDFLFGATQRPPALADDPVADEPVADEPVAEPMWGETAGWHTSAAPFVPVSAASDVVTPLPIDPEPSEAQLSEPDPVAAGGLIDALPWATPAAPPIEDVPRWTPPSAVSAEARDPARQPPAPQQSPVVVAGAPDEVAHTVDRAALLAALNDPPPVAGPSVLAGRCPTGHLSPPHAPVCRVCGTAMPQQDAVEIARPPLGIIRLSTGDTVALDRGVLLGRAPSEPAEGGERPHLVKLASPENDISRNHAEIVLDGWHVFVRDLGSTNGTVVTLPGRAPTRLRVDDLQLLENGSVVTLADEVSLTFEVTA